jgi:hypothetical protein
MPPFTLHRPLANPIRQSKNAEPRGIVSYKKIILSKTQNTLP